MCSIAANNCNVRQHRKVITLSKTSAGGLDLRCKDDSNFLHSIDSHHMVKILCAYKDYFQWDVLLIFTCNMKKNDTKPIRKWLDNNEWKIYFPNWDTYSFFLAARNKKSFTSICFRPIYKSLGRSQYYIY